MLAADVAGYSRLMGADELGTLQALKAIRREIVDPAIAAHKGRIVKTTGDGMLVEFASAVDAVTSAVTIQDQIAGRNETISFRIGINVGDIIIDDDDIFGDGVNVAARVESECEPGGVCLSGSAYEQVRGKTAFAFDDLGDRSLKNIERPVRLYSARSASTTSAKPHSEMTKSLPLPDRPSIAVLPFQNMSDDPEQGYFADGIVDDIITALSRFKSLFVIARNSSFIYKGAAVDIKLVGRELGVRYVLEGSVRKAGRKVRIVGQLIDAVSGAHVWADRFDGSLEDIFELQDNLTTSVVGAIVPKLEQVEIDRAKRKPIQNLDAYDSILRGMDCLQTAGDREKDDEALRFFYRAIELDPQSASAYGWAASRYHVRKMNGWIVDKEREFAEARRLIECAIKFGQDDAVALSRVAFALSFIFVEHEQAATLVDSAIAMNSNLAIALRARSWISVYLGEHEKALNEIDRAIRVNPIDPQNYHLENARGFALLFMGKYDEACHSAERALAIQPRITPSLRIASVGHALSGRLDQARAMMGRLREIDTVMRLSNVEEWSPFNRKQDVERFLEGLRLAGLPD
ncbi:adenylate/guanylate cyclase domain-containing protein [Bradyrhizobium guangzhouense]|uniref:adenylate/guanylate cyclase domain-containing protein n=1 Tax=Bradyrhizobium guangzhouense TaxID=1325095 RepID=UPI001FE0C6FD|nr:adenylate/guanylate cyclase domain-containing protein [Bradyrhizobium guangzhouense]